MTQKDKWANRAEQRNEWACAAETTAAALLANRNSDWAFVSQPGHIPARAAENQRSQRAFELLEKAKAHREKATNLAALANRNVGDAERKRQEIRDASNLQPGDRAVSVHYGACEIVKSNAKTYRIRTASGFTTTQDKSFVKAAA